MAKFSLCIEPVMPELDFYDRIPAAAQLGYDAVEFWALEGRDLGRVARLAQKNGQQLAAFCLQDAWAAPLNGPAGVVAANIAASATLAKDAGCRTLIALSGNASGPAGAQKRAIIENLKRAADVLVKTGVTLVVEALNTAVDHRGYFLAGSKMGFDIIRQVGCENVRLLYDIYHMQIMEGNLIQTVTTNLPSIGHFHSAGVPGRHEHFLGELDYRQIVKAIDNTRYDGYIGLEYWPTYDHRRSLGDVLAYLKG
jgi:hydroxypyruvate isomerase